MSIPTRWGRKRKLQRLKCQSAVFGALFRSKVELRVHCALVNAYSGTLDLKPLPKSAGYALLSAILTRGEICRLCFAPLSRAVLRGR
jgi:hypothetical protein